MCSLKQLKRALEGVRSRHKKIETLAKKGELKKLKRSLYVFA